MEGGGGSGEVGGTRGSKLRGPCGVSDLQSLALFDTFHSGPPITASVAMLLKTRLHVRLIGGCDYAEVAGAKRWLCVSNYSGTEPIDQPLQSNLFTTDV